MNIWKQRLFRRAHGRARLTSNEVLEGAKRISSMRKVDRWRGNVLDEEHCCLYMGVAELSEIELARLRWLEKHHTLSWKKLGLNKHG